jgi:hypothetical protein
MTAKWIGVLAVAAINVAGWSQSQLQDRFAITADQVARAVSAGGIEVAAEQVSLPANVVSTEPNPVLDVLSVEPLSDRWFGGRSGAHSWVKLACRTPGECLPFYAVVSRPTESPGRAPSNSRTSLAALKLKPNAEISMRAGAHAMLVMDDGRAHIKIAVVTLENGVVGHRIRVATPDHKQVYVAEVVNESLLRKSF